MNKNKNLAFLSMDNMEGFVSDDELAIAPLNELGWNVRTVSWRADINWEQFDMAILRTTWDYQNNYIEFINVLKKIYHSGVILQNSIDIVKWNINKNYLAEISNNGSLIVTTLWKEKFHSLTDIKKCFDDLNTDEIIIKPTISANADNTFRLKKNEIGEKVETLEAIFIDRSFMVQPFMQRIIDEGEFSLFYFNGEYSHSIRKQPKQDDFRVQEEHGGIISSAGKNSEQVLKAEKVLASINEIPLYARIDFVRNEYNEFAIMEVELIEPALYFRMSEGSAYRFAKAVEELYLRLK